MVGQHKHRHMKALTREIKILLVLLFTVIWVPAVAVTNTEFRVEQGKAQSPIILKFRVVMVRYEQQGDILFTYADAEVLDVIRANTSISQASTVKIAYGVNYVDQGRQGEKMQEYKMPGLAPTLQLPWLREGDIATGWFDYSDNGKTLIPSIGYHSFDFEVHPEVRKVRSTNPVKLSLGEVVQFLDSDAELRLAEIEFESACPPKATCVIGGFWVLQFDLIVKGRHRLVRLVQGRPQAGSGEATTASDGYRLNLLNSDIRTFAVVRLLTS